MENEDDFGSQGNGIIIWSRCKGCNELEPVQSAYNQYCEFCLLIGKNKENRKEGDK